MRETGWKLHNNAGKHTADWSSPDTGLAQNTHSNEKSSNMSYFARFVLLHIIISISHNFKVIQLISSGLLRLLTILTGKSSQVFVTKLSLCIPLANECLLLHRVKSTERVGMVSLQCRDFQSFSFSFPYF